ncbi:MAG TPA: DmsE family decaheme c-type cytochrome [Vicinamibacterales bacterium]|jgi:DmsE family decaheme c-type cytochrome|nr:DmsE family decaheme c-type cytochrome [Vicinamibacterales bacterium]
MKRFGDWALFLATLMAVATVGISAMAFPAPDAALAAPAAAAPSAPAPTSESRSPGAPVSGQAAQSGYLGSEACAVCHENYDKTIEATKHGFKGNALAPASKQGCESCHGPGEAHAQDPANVKPIQFNKVAAHTANSQCQQCHNRGEHALWDGSQHENRNLKCIDCHSVHSSEGEKLMRAKTQQLTCARCHQTITNKQQRFNHMPVREGKMTCSSCHNVHGSVNVKLLRVGTTVDQSCTSCHTEKRGPFLWEHAPVVDSCTTCHDSHGSNNDRMLQAKLPFLCQRCHVTSRHPPTVYEGFTLQNSGNANKMYAKACANCHQQVHGSNHPNGKFFLR